MATTISKIKDRVDQFIRDTSEDSVTNNDRFRAITEAVQQLYNEFEFEFTNRTSTINYLDGVNYYDVTTSIDDLLGPVDLRRDEDDHNDFFTRKSPREVAVRINNGIGEKEFAIEIRDRKKFLVINYNSKYYARQLHDCDDTDTNGTWIVDSSGSDATNLTQDTVEFKQGSGALNFDVDVSQSGNDLATIEIDHTNDPMNSLDLTDEEDLASMVWWAYIPDTTNFSSITSYWGSSDSAYWSATATTDLNGNSFVDGWNELKVDWADATKTGTPDVTAVDYLRFDFNYTGSQSDDTDFRIDDIRMIRPEKLTFHYQSWDVGQNNSGTDIKEFTATNDVPFYSGIYDHFNTYVSHQAASILLDQMNQSEDANKHEAIAARELGRLKKKMPSSHLSTTRNFKVKGLNFS